jgi:hypothetical protein
MNVGGPTEFSAKLFFQIKNISSIIEDDNNYFIENIIKTLKINQKNCIYRLE